MRLLSNMLPLLCALFAAVPALAEAPLALPSAPQVQLVQRIGAVLPLDVSMVESNGKPMRLREFFGGDRAVVLVPGYYQCTELCGLVMQGVLEALQGSGLPQRSWRIVGFSIDPDETPAMARARESDYRDYARFLADRDIDIHLLTTSAPTSERLTRALGYAVQRGDNGIAHSAGFVVATPQGTVARYFPGVRFDARELRLAVEQAAGGHVGSLTDRLTLLCGHYDPVTGRYSVAVMDAMRILGCMGAIAMGLWIWRRRAASAS